MENYDDVIIKEEPFDEEHEMIIESGIEIFEDKIKREFNEDLWMIDEEGLMKLCILDEGTIQEFKINLEVGLPKEQLPTQPDWKEILCQDDELLSSSIKIEFLPRSCMPCNMYFADDHSYNKHFKICHVDAILPPPTYFCRVSSCSYQTSNQWAINRHINSIHNKMRNSIRNKMREKKTFDCPDCDRKFSCGRSLRNHVNSVHKKPFKCSMCVYKANTNRALNSHLMRIHNKSRLDHHLNINNCQLKKPHQNQQDEQEDTSSQDQKQINSKESTEIIMTFGCIKCNQLFISDNALKLHIRKDHTEMKPYFCIECSYQSAYKFTLMRHIKTVHDKIKDLQCPECVLKFSCSKNMRTHINCVHRKLKPFLCKLCKYAAATKTALQAHLDGFHNKLKPFTCSECSNIFATKAGMKQHVNSIHSKLRPYKCKFCFKKFFRRFYLRGHLKNIHKFEEPGEENFRKILVSNNETNSPISSICNEDNLTSIVLM